MPLTPLARLLQPRSIAILGASDDGVSIGGSVLGNLERAGFAGDIHLVSRSKASIQGRACVGSIGDLPPGVDAVVLATPADAVRDAVAACIERGVGGAVVFAAGFAEMGAEGLARQSTIARLARAAGLALNGPNCAGFVNYLMRAPLTFNRFDPSREAAQPGVAIIAQSGAMTSNIDEALHARGLAVTHGISTGNEAVVGIVDYLGFVLDQPTTRLVVIFAEQVRDPAAFLALADRARAMDVPIVLMHPGRTARAQASALSHTGAMAGDYAVMATMLRHHGVRVVETLDELFDVAVLLARWPRPSVGGVMLMTNSGAVRSVGFDFAESVGLDVPPLAPSTVAALAPRFPAYATLDNPLDLLTLGLSQPDIYRHAGQLLLDDPACGGLVFASTPGPAPVQVAKARCMLPLMDGPKPVAFVMMGDEAALSAPFLSTMAGSGAPLFRSMDRAMRAMAHVLAPAGAETPSEAAPVDAPAVPVPCGGGPLAEHAGKAVLAAMGVAVPGGGLATTVEEAIGIATRVGFPVVLKAQARALTHKTEAGGVALGIGDGTALRAAWVRMQADVARHSPGLALDGILVEAMASRGVEMIVGARRDPGWGVVTLVGMGGIAAEAFGDVRLMPAGIGRAAIESEIGRLRSAVLLRGFRGTPPCDVAAVALAVDRVAALMLANPRLSVVEINPLVVHPAGQGATALDALLITDGE